MSNITKSNSLKKTDWRDVTTVRRDYVAQLRLRGFSMDDVAMLVSHGYEPLNIPPFPNPKTGNAWTKTTIFRDLEAITAEWRNEMLQAVSAHKARVLAELQEVKRVAWELYHRTNDRNVLETILKTLSQETKLLGADAPLQIEYTWKHEIVALYQTGQITRDDIVSEFGESLAQELFADYVLTP